MNFDNDAKVCFFGGSIPKKKFTKNSHLCLEYEKSLQKVHRPFVSVWFKDDYRDSMNLSQSFAVPSPSKTFCCIRSLFVETVLTPIAISLAMLEGGTSILMSMQMWYSVSEKL